MSLGPGARIGPYQITALIGEGGMGKVWRARHAALNRDDALKVLPEAFASDPDRLARFRREAQVLASLNHPNIAHVYGLEQADGIQALVMELVEGPTLADRIARGPIPLDEALPIARQIAEALEAAHERSIIHRDLKPANVKLRPDSTVKVLDFGLAKALEPASTPGVDATASPTITSPAMMTGVGILLGTAAYMSPEQAKGKPADRRSDIWAFGCVLYEMLTGRRAFEGDDVSDTLAAVLRGQPDWTHLPVATPSSVRRLLVRCLEKNNRNRLADIGDARLDINESIQVGEPATGLRTELRVNGVPTRASRLLPWLVATGALALGLLVGFVIWSPTRTTQPAPLRFTADLGADVTLVNQGSALVLSRDGTRLAFVAPTTAGQTSHLYVRRLTDLQATSLNGTDGARNPFFSPDGQWIGFFADGKLKKVAFAGGAAVTLCDAVNDRGGAWGDDGFIVFSDQPGTAPASSASTTGLKRVPSAGGSPEALTTLTDGETTQRWPQMLPGSASVMFTSHRGGGNFDDANIVVQSLTTGNRKVLRRGGYFGRYVSSGHFVYMREGTLFAAPFDLDRLEVAGPSAPVLENVLSGPTGTGVNGAAQVDVSDTGILVYASGESFAGAPISWMDRSGRLTPLRKASADWNGPRFSPDGQQLAIEEIGPQRRFIAIYDWRRDTLTRLTLDSEASLRPAWTPDGRRISFTSRRGAAGTGNLYWRRADGSGEEQRLTESPNNQDGGSWHPGGRILAYTEARPGTGFDLMLLQMDGDEESGWKPGTPTVLLSTPFGERDPVFSPDGRWIAYTSDESGNMEVYVRPFPGPGGKWLVSSGGGFYPTWADAKREIVYQDLTNQRIMVVPYTVDGDSFAADAPLPWAERRFLPLVTRAYDLHPDGERLALAVREDPSPVKQDEVIFVLNFFDELRRITSTP